MPSFHSGIPSYPCAVILGGGRGTRLYPLTHHRCKPAVPLAGKYRLIDIALSNCIHSHLKNIYVITQFNSASLNQHIAQTYRFDQFSNGFVNILAASQTGTNDRWHQGTADAIRANLDHLLARPYTHFVILPGDSLCRIDYRMMLRQHIRHDADITICCKPVSEHFAPSVGIVDMNADKRILAFHEKPAREKLSGLKSGILSPDSQEMWIGSMGMYIFNRDVLAQLLRQDLDATDLSRQIIPNAVNDYKIMGFLFQDYWRDIGTISSLFKSSLRLVDLDSVDEFRFYDNTTPMFTRLRNLPSPEINSSSLDHVIVSEGSRITGSIIKRSIIGLRSVIQDDVSLENVVVMGNDYFVQPGSESNSPDFPPTGIGKGTTIRNSIIDKNSRIGKNCRLINMNNINDLQSPNLWIRDGIIVIPKNAIVPDNTEI